MAIAAPADVPTASEGPRSFVVEVWLQPHASAPTVVAECGSPGIGYAAYYAALREYPGCALRLRDGPRTLSQRAAAG